MKAYQRLIREDRAATKADEDGLWGAYWAGAEPDIKKSIVRQISSRTAAQVILKYEWMRSMPAKHWECYGIFFDEVLAGAVVYAPDYVENLGVWDRYGYTGKIILLARGACTHWAHPHAGSKLIRRSMAMLPAKYEVVTATVDPLAGEVGIIYQACGFDYVGVMGAGNGRLAWRIKGRLVGERMLRRRIGTNRPDDVLRAYPDAKPEQQAPKGRYFAFRGSSHVKSQHRSAIAHLIQPYPKHAVAASSDAPGFQSGEGGSQPTLPLHSSEAVA